MSILGSIIIDNKSFFNISDVIEKEDFYQAEHQTIYEAIVELMEQNSPVDMVILPGYLEEKNNLAFVGGSSYVAKLIERTPSSANINKYAEIVKRKSIIRQMIDASYRINEIAYKEEGDIDDMLDESPTKNIPNSSKRVAKKI